MNLRTIIVLMFYTGASAFAGSDITDLELGVLSCIEKTTNLGADSSNKDKEKIVNAIFDKVGISTRYTHVKHHNAIERYKMKDADLYYQGYSACDGYMYKIDPEGAKYSSHE